MQFVTSNWAEFIPSVQRCFEAKHEKGNNNVLV
jgi:hypothetical protein